MREASRLLTALGLSLMLASCRPELPFETIERDDAPDKFSRHWQSWEPGLLIIASSEDVEAASQFLSDETGLALSQLDFTTHFAIIAFRGFQPTTHEGFQIERIIRQNREVALYAQAGRRRGQDEVDSPYHLIKVQKKGEWGSVFTFKLYFGEDEPEVASVSHRIP